MHFYLSWLFSALAASLVLVTGCAARDMRHQTDYVIGGIYEVQRPLTAKKGKRVQLYDPVQYPQVNGISIPKGTLIKIVELELDTRGPLAATLIWVRAQFVDGPLKSQPAELAFVSRPKSPSISVPMVNPDILKLVRQPQK